MHSHYAYSPTIILVEVLESLEQVLFLLKSMAMHGGCYEFIIINSSIFVHISLKPHMHQKNTSFKFSFLTAQGIGSQISSLK